MNTTQKNIINTELWSCDTKGIARKYTVVSKTGWAPAPGCDILVEDRDGNINSAKSVSYHLTYRDALADALASNLKSREVHQKWIDRINEDLDRIYEQVAKENDAEMAT